MAGRRRSGGRLSSGKRIVVEGSGVEVVARAPSKAREVVEARVGDGGNRVGDGRLGERVGDGGQRVGDGKFGVRVPHWPVLQRHVARMGGPATMQRVGSSVGVEVNAARRRLKPGS